MRRSPRFPLGSLALGLFAGMLLELSFLPGRRLKSPRFSPRWRGSKIRTLIAHVPKLAFPSRSNVEEPHILRVLLDEFLARLNLIAHQILKRLECEQLVLLIE